MFLYKLTNRKAGLSYIGATTRKRLNDRLGLHRHRANLGDRKSFLHVAIREHGWDAFEVTILAQPSSRKDLMMMERAAIAAANTFTPNGYNQTSGGDGQWNRPMTQKAKIAISNANSNRKPWNYWTKTGPMSDESRKKMSDARKGQRPWNVGIPHSDETKEKLKASAPKGSAQWQARPLEYMGVRYDCIREACRATGLSVMQIRYRLQTGRAKDLRQVKEN